MNCPSCRHILHEDARFCSHCGLSTAPIPTSTGNSHQQETLKYTVPPDTFSGRILDSKYELLKRLGEGGMGVVYRARRLHIGDEVAVKVLHSDLVVDKEAVERFRREARSAAMINHPNVVSIHDFNDGRVEGTPAYIVMELVRGVSLRELLKSEGRLAPERAVALMRDVCAGVGVAHRQGLVHRDLKPDNVIVAPASHDGDLETAKVVDFGIAKLRDRAAESGLTQTGAVVGTIYYMSPEQCRGEKLDPRSDVYSLGAMLYEMLSGTPPFQANNLTGLITRHLYDPPPALPPELKIPPALAAICYRALAKNRDDRQADALALRKELQRAFAPLNEKPKVSDEKKKSVSWIKWTVVGVGTLSVLLLVAGAFGFYFYRSQIPQPNLNVNASKSNSNVSDANTEITKEEIKSTSAHDLRGTWTGTLGPFKQATKLIIRQHKENRFEGVLEQDKIRVAFVGTFNPKSLDVTFKDTKVLSGEQWNLGENTGKLSADGKRMEGTGKDPIGVMFGITYEWSFSRK